MTYIIRGRVQASDWGRSDDYGDPDPATAKALKNGVALWRGGRQIAWSRGDPWRWQDHVTVTGQTPTVGASEITITGPVGPINVDFEVDATKASGSVTVTLWDLDADAVWQSRRSSDSKLTMAQRTVTLAAGERLRLQPRVTKGSAALDKIDGWTLTLTRA